MLTTLLSLLGADVDKDMAKFCLSVAIDHVLDYCNIPKIPLRLKTTVIRIAADIYRVEGYGNAEAPDGAVQSVKEGEQSITYATGSRIADISGVAANIVKGYEREL